MSQFLQDFRFAFRNLRKEPSLALAAVLTLALGIGVNAAIFSVVDAALLTPPPFRDPERVMVVWGSNSVLPQTEGLGVKGAASNANLFDWQEKSHSFASLSMLQAYRLVLTGQGEPELIGVTLVSGDFFNVLTTPALVGRTLDKRDETEGLPTVAVLSHALWQRRFSGDPKIVGKTITLGGSPFTVVGVMPPRFTFPRGGIDVPAPYGFAPDSDAWLPVPLPPGTRDQRGARFNVVVGRLAPGVSQASAEAELKGISRQLAQAYPQTDAGWSVYLVPLVEQLRGSVQVTLLLLWAAVGVVLLIACVNVANLLLARAASRQKEISLRMAMGASRGRLMSQLLAESAVLSLLGGILGVALAWAGLRAFVAFLPTGAVEATSFVLSGRALAFTAALCIVTTFLAGLVPALQMTRPDLAGALREGTRAGAGTAGSRRTRSGLVVVEVALAVLVLIGAGLLLRSFSRLLDVDPGFRPQGVLSFELGMPLDRYPPPQRLPFLEQVLAGVKAVPGVVDAAIVSDLPLDSNGGFFTFLVEGRPEPSDEESLAQVALVRTVSPAYFEILEVPMRQGRSFTGADREDSLPVAVIDETLARDYWPGENAVGKRLRLRGSEKWLTVVGVAGGVREAGLGSDLQPQIYVLTTQNPGLVNFIMRMVVRTNGDPAALFSQMRAAVHELDPNQPVSRLRTLEQMVANSVAKPRFGLLLLGLFAALALVLSVVGIYGITSYSVAQRTREMGVRMALGAQPGKVLGLVVGETGLLAGLGILLGLVAAFALARVLARFMTSVLFGVGATDPVTFAGVALVLVLISLLAAYLPGRRATKVSPSVALRSE